MRLPHEPCECMYYYVVVPVRAENVQRLFQLKKEHYRIWKIIGAELGIDIDTLNVLEKDHKEDTDGLHAVISCVNPALTYETMAKTLQSANITSAIRGTMIPPSN